MNMGSYDCCSSSTKNSKKVASLTSVLKIVAEENRLRLLCIMKDGGHCVCELMDHVEASQSLISHHLRDLKDAGIVKDKKRGLRVYYSLTAKGKRIVNTLFKL